MRRAHHPLFVVAVAAIVLAAAVLSLDRCDGRPTAARRPAAPPAPASSTVDRATLVRALEATRAVESGRVVVAFVLTHLRPEPDGPAGGRLPVATYRVAFDRRARRVDVEADMSGAASVLRAQAAAGADLSIAARMVAVGDVVYARGGPMAAAVGRAAADWVRIQRATLVARGPKSDAGSLVIDPLGPFRVVEDATAGARVVGHDEIRGSAVTHLATSLESGGASAPLDVWIDADGVMRRLQVRLTGGVGAGGGELVTTVELFDIGRPVDIRPPGTAR
jgi:hypothetical protein